MRKLFGKSILPACKHCEHGKFFKNQDKNHILCSRKGVVAPDYHCRKYKYDPLKRVPKKNPTLPSYKQSDFTLDE